VSSDPDEAEEGPRKDVDYINLVSDDEGGDSILNNSFAPVRIHRVEHRDRAPPVNPDLGVTKTKKQEQRDEGIAVGISMSAVRKGKQRAKDNISIRKERPWKGVYEDDEVFISSDEDTSEAEHPTVSQPQPVVKTDHIQTEALNKSRRRKVFNQKPLSFQTEEDQKEWERRQIDLETLVAELSHVELKSSGDGDTDMADPAAVPDAKADRVYLFQFPPVVPDLIPANILSKMERPESPAEGRTAESGPENPSMIALADQNTKEAKEEEVIAIKDENEEPTSVFPPRPAHLPNLASGRVGKLRVYKSGKAKLDWGGTSLQLNMGITPHFLQDSVLVKTNPELKDGVPVPSSNGFQGEAFAFGQVRGKFVVTPDWDEVMGGF
jgi:DNA-directed RNA polymerase III subunit RPC4